MSCVTRAVLALERRGDGKRVFVLPELLGICLLFADIFRLDRTMSILRYMLCFFCSVVGVGWVVKMWGVERRDALRVNLVHGRVAATDNIA